MDTLVSLRVFAAVAEMRSFTAAAARLRLSPAMASKHVAHLENRLGTRLLNRTSRQVSLTETGTLYLSQVGQMLDGLDEVEAAVSNVAVTPKGRLRLSAPVWIASDYFADMLAGYHRRYPEVCLDIDLSGRIVNLVDEGFDLALRATASDRLAPGLIARPLAKIEFRMVAAPAYLNRTGRPTTVAALDGHAALLYSGMGASGSVGIGKGNDRKTVQFRPIIQSANETMLHLAALEGIGVTFLPTWMVQADIAAGRLEEVLDDQATFETTLHAIYPTRKYLSAKVRTFIDYLADLCGDIS